MSQKTKLPASFTELLEVLAGGKKLRQKFSNEFGRDYWVVTYWSRSNYIPAEDWDDLIAFAARKGVGGVTKEYLKSINPKKYMKSLSIRDKPIADERKR